MSELSISEENLLKSIYYFTVDKGNKMATTNDIAKSLSIKASSATEMIKKLNDKRWLVHIPYRGCALTPKGLSYITSLVRRHRIWETFLTQTLQFGWHEVHPIAEELEHVNSPKLIDRLYDFLEKPTHDPHGHLIPSSALDVSASHSMQLSTVNLGHKVRIVSVSDKDSELLNILREYPLKLGQVLTVKEINPSTKQRMISTSDEEFSLPDYITNIIYVKDYE